MAIMGDRAFPYPGIGTVHLENTITAHRAIGVGEVLDLVTAVGAPRPHRRAACSTSSPPSRPAGRSSGRRPRRTCAGGGERGATGGPVPEGAPTGGVEWRLPADLGRNYAAVSGDHNPIHLYPLTAKVLGFKRQIAHGMWTLARSVAAIENRLPDAVTVAVTFKKPVFLPGTVAFADTVDDGVHTFALTDPRTSSPHLLGRATPA